MQQILTALEREPDGLSVPQLMARVNVSKRRIEKTLELLSLESPAPLAKVGTRWQLTPGRLQEEFWQRAERLAALRRAEQQQMQEYVNLDEGHMDFLIRALDGPPAEYTPPTLPPLPGAPNDALVRDAVLFLRRSSIPIEARGRWPIGGLPRYGVSGLIPPTLRAEEGRALCVWGDAGWGQHVRRGKYQDGRFSDELVDACATMIRRWNPQPAPGWVTCVPSLRHPELVPGFARRVALKLGMPFHRVLRNASARPEQKTMENNTQQARNVDGSIEVISGTVPARPVLLIDDIFDSRWTLTVCAWLLRRAGSGPVWPVTLAQAGRDE